MTGAGSLGTPRTIKVCPCSIRQGDPGARLDLEKTDREKGWIKNENPGGCDHGGYEMKEELKKAPDRRRSYGCR